MVVFGVKGLIMSATILFLPVLYIMPILLFELSFLMKEGSLFLLFHPSQSAIEISRLLVGTDGAVGVGFDSFSFTGDAFVNFFYAAFTAIDQKIQKPVDMTGIAVGDLMP